MKKSIKKIFAVGVSVALLATTMVGALADLSNYPSPFVDQNGVFNGAIVVGENAATADVLGAIDIAASLQSAAKTAVAVGDSSVEVEGGESYDDMYLTTTWPAANLTLKETKLDGFVDSDFDVDGDTVDYHDEVLFVADAVTLNPATSEDEAGAIYAEVAKDSVEYRVYFEDTAINNAVDEDTSAEFEFLGQSVEAYGFDFTAGGDFTILSSTEKAMVEGDEVTIGAYTITLVRVGSTSAIIDVNGQTKVVADGVTEKFNDADDFEVSLDSLFYIEGASDNIANLKLGLDQTEVAVDGEAAVLFGQVDDNTDADWVWSVGNESGTGFIGLRLNKDYDTIVIQNEDTEKMPLFLGDSISLPNDYAALEFASLAADYENVVISLDDKIWLDDGEDLGNDGYFAVVKLEADSDYFNVGLESAETVYIAYNTSFEFDSIWYVDGDDEIKTVETDFDLTIDVDAMVITPVAGDVTMVLSGESLTFTPGVVAAEEFDFFGLTDEADTDDLVYDTANIGNKDWSFMTDYGIVIDATGEQFDSGSSFTIAVPSERESATLVVKSMGSSVSAAATGSAYMVNPIEVGMGMLDSEATLGTVPMIVIGGPNANTLAKELLGFPTAEEVAATFSEGKAMIKWYETEQAMLVAGWSAQDTRGASYVVADYANYDFAGEELEVVVTDLTNIDVMAK